MPIADPITIDAGHPQAFPQAVEYFALQAPWLSGSSWQAMAELAANRAAVVTGAAMLAMVDDVWKGMDRALRDGLPYSEFIRDMGQSLHRDWMDIDGWHTRLIYRNNVGSALMAGRVAQMSDPDVLEDRPYWLLDVIEDMDTSDICRPLDGVILPASDPFWCTHQPPLHHNCRTSLISLDEEDAAELGGVTPIRKVAALPPPASGFGSPSSWENWTPDGSDYHPALFAEYLAWRDGTGHASELAEWRGNLLEAVARGASLSPEVMRPVETGKRLPGIEPAPRRGAPETAPAPAPKPRPTQQRPAPAPVEVRATPSPAAAPMEPPPLTPELEAKIRTALDAWVVGSKSKRSVTLKRAAITELGLPGVAYSRVRWQISEADVDNLRPVVARVYADTQAALRKRYPSGRVILYRGLKTPPPVSVLGTLESWSTDLRVAEGFAGRRRMRRGQPGAKIKGAEKRGEILQYEIPIESILSFSGGPHWRNGRFGEQAEYVVTSAYVDAGVTGDSI